MAPRTDRLRGELLLGTNSVFFVLFAFWVELIVPRMTELPMYEAVGAPAGVKLPAEDGGGPAGVVEGSSPKYWRRPRWPRSGVAGSEEPSSDGSWNRPDIVRRN